MDAYSPAQGVRIVAAGIALTLAGCLTVAPTGFVRLGEHGCHRVWCDCNTLGAPALFFETARRVPYAEERVRCYPPIDRRMPGPRLLLTSEEVVTLSGPAAAPITAPGSSMNVPRDADGTAPPPAASEPELLPPPPNP